MKNTVYPPDLFITLQRMKADIFDGLNCAMPGKINKFYKATQSADIEITMKKKISDTNIVEYPMLVDCPVFFLQGGGAFIEFPIKANDPCIVLFCDKDIDDWYSSGISKEPNTARKHSLSDGFAIVGINPSSNPLSLDNDKVRIYAGTYPIVLETTLGTIEIAANGNITMNDGTEAFILGTAHKTALLALCTAIAAIVPSNPVTSAQFAALQTAFSTFNGTLANMLSTQIKGK